MKIKKIDCYEINGTMQYLIIHNSCHDDDKDYIDDRNDIIVPTEDEPVTIGRELPFKYCLDLIGKYETIAKKDENYFGARIDVLRIVEAYKKK